MTLADLLNSPTEIAHGGKTYRLREPTLLEQGELQRWLEQRAYDAIERRTYQDPAQQERDRRNLTNDVAAGVFEYGGEVCCQTLQTPAGVTKLVSLVLRDQGVTAREVEQLVQAKLREIAAVIVARSTDDPKAVAAVLARLGLPPDFLSATSSSDSPTPPSGTGSTTSGPSPTPS